MQKQFYPVIGTEKALPFYIIGIGVSCWQFPVSRPEGYDYPQLFVCLEGEGEVTVDGKTVKIMPDSIFYIPPHCPHKYRATTHSWYLDWVCFDGKQALELLKEWDLNKFHVFLNCGAERMHKLFDSAYYTIKSDKAYGNYYASAQLYDMLLEYRKLSDDKFPYKSRVNSEAVAKVMKYTEENYSKPIKLADMAAVAGVSEQHLCRLFKKNFSIRPMEYLNTVRISHAKELLTYSSKTVAEIASETGFSDSSYFYVVFKKHENISPAEYRKIKA